MHAVRYLLVALFLLLNLSEARRRACPIKNICKRIRMVQKKLRKATEAMTTQGKMISGRLDAAEGKIDDIGNIGKKLTDLLSQQGNKIKEQGDKLAAEETKLAEQLKTQMTTYTTKLESFTSRVTTLTEQNIKLTDLVTAQDARIGSLQTEGVKVLDKLDGTTKKLEGKVVAQTAKLSAQLPLPDGKFTEIAKGHSQCQDKMSEFQSKFDSMQAMVAALKEKLSNAESKLTSIGDSHAALAGKVDVVGTDIDAQEKAMADITSKLKETDAKIGDIAAKGAVVADNLAQATAKVGAVASAKLKMKEKLTKQMETATAIKEQALSVAGKMKEHEMKLGKVQAELDKPKEPPPPPKGSITAGLAGGISALGDQAAQTTDEEIEKMEKNLQKITEIDMDVPFPVTAFFSEPNGSPLTKDNEIAYLTNLPKTFEVSFEVKPTKFAPGWHSVLHMTTGGNCCNYGQRIPGVWYNNNRLYTSSAVSGSGNFGKFHGEYPPVNEWVKIRINQKEEDGGKWMYRVFQNNIKVIEAENLKPQNFKDVKVYTGDPWYAPQEGYIRKLRIHNMVETPNPMEFFDTDGDGIPLKKDNEIGLVPVLSKDFEISFEFKPTKFTGGWSSLIHLTKGGNCCNVGQRIPALWYKDDKIATSFSVNGNGNFWSYHKKVNSLNEWVKLKITQKNEMGMWMYRVFQNDEKQIEKENTKPEDFKDVKVYAGSPWYEPQTGNIRNLKIKTA